MWNWKAVALSVVVTYSVSMAILAPICFDPDVTISLRLQVSYLSKIEKLQLQNTSDGRLTTRLFASAKLSEVSQSSSHRKIKLPG